jgi:hypothetical protein
MTPPSLDTLILAASREAEHTGIRTDRGLKSALAGASYKTRYPLSDGEDERIIPILKMVLKRGKR